jgi:pimeloyl-ACP methyl ester carboxylesterase
VKYDHPAALRELRKHVGDRQIHVIAHCLGSMSFTMSLAAGTVDGITSMISNSVSLIQRVPRWSRLKLMLAPGFLEYVLGLSFLDPRFGDAPVLTRGWMLSRVVSLFHRECTVRSCHMVSFMWGTGHPAIQEHANLLPVTHERTADLESAVGVHYYRHIRKMVKAGHAVKYDPNDSRHADLPNDYLANAREITTPIMFLTGDRNHVFTDSIVVCYELMSKIVPDRHELEVLPGYSHQDSIVGKNAHLDVFPQLVDFLKRHSGGTR